MINGRARAARSAGYVLRNLLLALICLPIARLGLVFAFENGNISLVWPLTGIALAVLLLWGRKYWPGLWLVVFVSNLMSQSAPLVCFGIASGSTATALIAAYVLQERVEFRLSLARVSDVLNFVAAGAILTPLISAAVGVGSLYLGGQVPRADAAMDWFTWWVGDAMGVLVVAPALLIWGKIPFRLPSRFRMIEALSLIALLVITCWLVFSQGFAPSSFYPLAYLIFPFLIWGALRFDLRMVVTLTAMVSLIAVVQTGAQLGSFSSGVIWNGLVFLWAYLATMAITSMLLAATLAERHDIERTVGGLEQRFSKAFHAMPAALWIASVDEERFIDVNDEFCAVIGYTREELLGKTSLELNVWEAPEARDWTIKLLRDQGRVSQTEARLRSKWGETRYGLLSVELIELEGKPHVLNMFHDLTARLQAEDALRDSEERYRQLFEGIDDAIFVHDFDANILDVNEATCRRLGYSRDELLSMKVTDLDVPDFAAGFPERLRHQLEQGSLSQIEGVQIGKDGREIFIDVNSKLITYKGQPAILAVARDISERERAEQQLRASETRYRAIVEDQTEMICRLSPEWEINFVNDAYCRYFGKTREELVGSQFTPTIYEQDYPMVAAVITGLTPENPVAISEHRVIMADGSLRWHQLTDRAIFDERGQVSEYQFVGKDITDAKEMEQQRLAVALEREKVQILADFIAAASHDFRTPLSVINTSAYLLNRVMDSEQRDHHFRQIQEQTYNIERLVDGLLTMSRLDRGDVFRFKTVNLNSVIGQIEVRKRPEIEDKRQQLTLDLAADLRLIEADEGWLYRCIVQLVDNAIHYTPDGGTITLRTEQQPDHVIVTVSDTGVGIRAADLPHIFKRLYRAEVHRPVGGQGLGLSIAAKIVEAHQGSIEVESEPGVGSTFRIRLPLKRVDADSAAATASDSASATDTSRQPSPPL